MVDYGSSPVLTQEFDLEIDSTGDILCTSQTIDPFDEIEKDLSFKLASELDELIGTSMKPTQKALLETAVRDIVSRDPRIERIINIDVTELRDTPSGRGLAVALDVDIINATLDEPLIIQL